MDASVPTLAVNVWGEGPPVSFVHGLGASSRYWDTLRRHSRGYRGTAVDLVGFGASPKPEDGPYDVDFHLTALDPHVPSDAVVVAHSTGAIMAVALAARRPVRGLLLLGLPAYENPAMARHEIGRLGPLARWTVERRPIARALCTAMCRLRPLAMLAAPYYARDVPPSVAVDGLQHTWNSYHRTLIRVVVEHPVLPDLLDLEGTPVVVLQGRADRTAPPEHVERLRDRGAPIDVRVVDGDHHLALRRPEVVAGTLAELLATTGWG